MLNVYKLKHLLATQKGDLKDGRDNNITFLRSPYDKKAINIYPAACITLFLHGHNANPV